MYFVLILVVVYIALMMIFIVYDLSKINEYLDDALDDALDELDDLNQTLLGIKKELQYDIIIHDVNRGREEAPQHDLQS